MEKTKRTTAQKIGGFFLKNYPLFVAPIIVAVLYMVMLALYGVYPFGNKYTAASYDLSAQIAPFIEHIFDVIDGRSTLTYSYAIVGGADVTGTFLYFFISPFSFLFLILGDGKVAHASSIVMTCKLAAIAFAGTWFSKKMFKGIPDYICIAIGVVYTFCGYTFVANTYINWLDFLIYMPFCVAAFRHFVKTDNFWFFSIAMACCIYTCFSIACFSMFTVFPALIAYSLLCIEKGRKHKFIARLCLAFFGAVVMALPVLLPALMAYTTSGREGDIFENLWNGFTVTDGVIGDFDSSVFEDKLTQSVYAKWSYIISDAVFVLLTIVWFFRKGIKHPFAKFMILAGVFTLLPTVVDEAMNLMNMGSYMSYALRFGFLNALYFLGGACLCVEDLCYKRGCAYDGNPIGVKREFMAMETPADNANDRGRCALNGGTPMQLKEKRKASYYVVLAILITLAAAVVALLLWYIWDGNYRSFLALFTKDREKAYNNLGGFSSSFAHSLGGLEVVFIPFLLIAVVVGVGAVLVAKKKASARLLSLVLIAVVSTQVLFYGQQIVVGNMSTQHVTLGNYAQLCNELNERDDSYFRVKDYDEKVNANATFTGNSNSFSVFSSVIDEDNFITYQLFGYRGNGKNSYKSAHSDGKTNRADEFGDSFLGYKYYLVPESKLLETDEKTHLKKVMTTDENGTETQLSCGEGNSKLYVYENTMVFPLGYRVDSGEFKFVAENIANATNRRKNQAELYEFLRGKDLEEFTGKNKVTASSAKELSKYLWGKAADVKVEAGKITARVTAKEGEYLFLNFVASKGYTVTVNGKKAELAENDLKFLSVALEEGENEVVFTYSSPYVKYAGIGAGAAVILLAALLLIVLKTKVVDKIAPVISWAGITLAVAVVAFFMIYPTGVFIAKLIEYAKCFFLKL